MPLKIAIMEKCNNFKLTIFKNNFCNKFEFLVGLIDNYLYCRLNNKEGSEYFLRSFMQNFMFNVLKLFYIGK